MSVAVDSSVFADCPHCNAALCHDHFMGDFAYRLARRGTFRYAGAPESHDVTSMPALSDALAWSAVGSIATSLLERDADQRLQTH